MYSQPKYWSDVGTLVYWSDDLYWSRDRVKFEDCIDLFQCVDPDVDHHHLSIVGLLACHLGSGSLPNLTFASKFAHISITLLPTPYIFCDIRAIQTLISSKITKYIGTW